MTTVTIKSKGEELKLVRESGYFMPMKVELNTARILKSSN